VNDASAAANVVGGLALLSRPSVLAAHRGTITIQDVSDALDEFSECVRYLNTRRSAGAVLSLDSEGDVQDALYLILRPWVRDLVPETPTDKIGNRYTIRDFVSRSLRLVLEAKYVRDKDHGKSISKEMHDDIEVYRHNPVCETILFFVYDPDSLIPDQRELKRTIEQSRVYDGRALACRLTVKP
jgi:hypothetical protein